MFVCLGKKMYQPLAFKVMQRFLGVGFELKEDIIKHQHNCKATGFWVNKSKEYNFLLIMHEHLNNINIWRMIKNKINTLIFQYE
jgi:hypothetical protein